MDYIKLIVNTAIIIIMCVIMAKQPAVYWLGLILGFVVMTIYNFDAIVKTLRKFLSKGKKRRPNAAR